MGVVTAQSGHGLENIPELPARFTVLTVTLYSASGWRSKMKTLFSVQEAFFIPVIGSGFFDDGSTVL